MAREVTGSIGPRRPGRDVSGPLTGPGQIRPGHAREPLAVPYVGANPVQRIEDRFEQFIALVKGCLKATSFWPPATRALSASWLACSAAGRSNFETTERSLMRAHTAKVLPMTSCAQRLTSTARGRDHEGRRLIGLI